MSDDDTSVDGIGANIANGTQDLAALAGLFGTDSVERNALATQLGNTSVAMSALSMLGILGLIKSTLKITLGLDRCRNAGFNLDSIRGLFGYVKGEPAARGRIFECISADVQFTREKIVIKRAERRLDDENTPMVAVGSEWKDGFKCQTVFNLGNVWHEKALLEKEWFTLTACFVCSGVTSWLILIVKFPWTWLKFVATVGLHACLMLMVSLPVWFNWRTGRPQRHLTAGKWELLHGHGTTLQQDGHLNLLLVKMKDGDVVHFQKDVSRIHSLPVRAAAMVVSIFAVVGYIAQYAIIKTGSHKEVIVWIVAQAVAAVLRLAYWTFGTNMDLPWTSRAEYAVLNNCASSAITLTEVIAACTKDTVEIPRWAWDYLSVTPFSQILGQAAIVNSHAYVPHGVKYHIFQDVNFPRLIENRRRTKNRDDAEYVENNMWNRIWTLALWEENNNNNNNNNHYHHHLETPSPPLHPFIVIPIEFRAKTFGPTAGGFQKEWTVDECFVQASVQKVSDDRRLVDSCSLFACDYDGNRLHMQPFEAACDAQKTCPWRGRTTNSHEHKDSGTTMLADGRIVHWIEWLLRQDPADRGLGYIVPFDRERKRHTYVTATAGTTDRQGDFYVYEQAWTGRIHEDLTEGIRDLKRYILGEYNCDALRTDAAVDTTGATDATSTTLSRGKSGGGGGGGGGGAWTWTWTWKPLLLFLLGLFRSRRRLRRRYRYHYNHNHHNHPNEQTTSGETTATTTTTTTTSAGIEEKV